MGTSCEIRFDNNPNGTFQSGQTITGVVILNLTEKKKFRALYLKIEGSAKCMWTVTKGAGSRRRSVTYSGKEDYLNQTTYLFGSQSLTTPIEMPAGITTYSFACVLPTQLPSSFEGKHGNIRYSCKAVLDRPWKTDKEFRLSFTVIKTEDLNLLAQSLMPSKVEIFRHSTAAASSPSLSQCVPAFPSRVMFLGRQLKWQSRWTISRTLTLKEQKSAWSEILSTFVKRQGRKRSSSAWQWRKFSDLALKLVEWWSLRCYWLCPLWHQQTWTTVVSLQPVINSKFLRKLPERTRARTSTFPLHWEPFQSGLKPPSMMQSWTLPLLRPAVILRLPMCSTCRRQAMNMRPESSQRWRRTMPTSAPSIHDTPFGISVDPQPSRLPKCL